MLARVLIVAGRLLLAISVFLAFLLPPLALFSPNIVALIWRILQLPFGFSRLMVFMGLPLLLLMLGFLLWWLLESWGKALQR